MESSHAALVEHVDTGDGNDGDPRRRFRERRPEHRRDVKMKQSLKHREGRARLVAREHREQFVFEFRLMDGAVRKLIPE